ncbi:hypothetical protein A3K42_01305 [candidate division WWE3 bacterium RBG_13_37_7]|uniref:Uncharacterized protein n=1 Tax=candidate division WWE3 bacterium RBG_13_37_7 TaxID=1802609 RepID=A0A1F4U228_UNCKA|nr:MAG: hypothetical protein A3K42_01305 [candidate division WWE3 bacterium RBG_13_37_7]
MPGFSIFIGIYVIINFLVMYCLAIEKIRVFLFFIPAVIAQYFLICRFHETLEDIVNINIAISAVLLFLILIYVFSTNLVQKR